MNLDLPQLIPAGIREHLEFDTPEGIDDTYRSEPRRRRRKDNLERLNDDDITDQSFLAARLRQDMKRDALSSSRQLELDDEQIRFNGSGKKNTTDDENTPTITPELVDQVREFLQQPVSITCILLHVCAHISIKVRERLQRVLNYMREKYHFCFWCGAEYNSKEDLDASCPGESEEDHD